MKMLSAIQVRQLIKAIGHEKTVIVEGENGIGKTSIAYDLRNDPMFANHIHIDPIDCTQLSDGSVWMPDIDREIGVSRELPNERFGVNKNNQKGVNGSRPSFIALDEIAKAKQYIKDVLAPIVYERRIGNYHMPEGSVVTCFTNLTSEGLGDSIQAHLKNRLIFVKMRKPTKDEWVHWASSKRGFSSEVLAFAEEYPKLFDSFIDYDTGGQFSDKQQEKHNPFIFNPRIAQDAYASPRSLATASVIVNGRNKMDDTTMQYALDGAIGTAAADALGAYVRFGRENPTFDEVRADPAHAKVASSPVAQIVMAFKLITNTETRDDAEAATEYVARMRAEMQSLFCNSVANSPKVSAFITVAPFQTMLKEHKIYFGNK
jgi:hypothetical protein